MNDRFKFRVWNMDIKEYLVGEFLVGGCGDMIHNVVDYESFLNKGNFIIEQCTGLKDKNGNLIYEGDVVIGRKEIVVCELKEYKDVVEYKDGAYFPFNWTGVYNPEKFEIIGNIHEQPKQKDVK